MMKKTGFSLILFLGAMSAIPLWAQNAGPEVVSALGDLETLLKEGTDPTQLYYKTGEACNFGAETHLPLDIAKTNILKTRMGTDRDVCNREKFANFVCSDSFFQHRKKRLEKGYSSLLRQSVYEWAKTKKGKLQTWVRGADGAPVMVESEVDNSDFLSRVSMHYNVATDDCVGQKPLDGKIKPGAQNQDPGYDKAKCEYWRREFNQFTDRVSKNPDFQAGLWKTATLEERMKQVNSQLLPQVKEQFKKVLQEKLCGMEPGSTNMDSSCKGVNTGIPQNALHTMLKNIENSEIVVPTKGVCSGDDDNVYTARKTGGGVLIYVCPRALMIGDPRDPNGVSLDGLSLGAQLARSLGHSVDSCAMEMASVDEKSLAPLGDELRACLAYNYLKDSGGGYPEFLKQEMDKGSRDIVLGRRGTRSSIHCSGHKSKYGGMVAGQTNVESNTLEAQYWANKVVAKMVKDRKESPGFAMNPAEVTMWAQYCAGEFPTDQRLRRSCEQEGNKNKKLFHLRIAFQPYCRGLDNDSASSVLKTRSLINMAAEDADLRELIAPAVKSCKTPPKKVMDGEGKFPMDPQIALDKRGRPLKGRRAVDPRLGSCGPELMATALNNLETSSLGPLSIQAGNGLELQGIVGSAPTASTVEPASDPQTAATETSQTQPPSPSSAAEASAQVAETTANVVAGAQPPSPEEIPLPAVEPSQPPKTPLSLLRELPLSKNIEREQNSVFFRMENDPKKSPTCAGSSKKSCGKVVAVNQDGTLLRAFDDEKTALKAGCGLTICYCETEIKENKEFHCIPGTKKTKQGRVLPKASFSAEKLPQRRYRVLDVPMADGTLEPAYPFGFIKNTGDENTQKIIYVPGHCFRGTTKCEKVDLFTADKNSNIAKMTEEEGKNMGIFVHTGFEQVMKEQQAKKAVAPVATATDPTEFMIVSSVNPSAKAVSVSAIPVVQVQPPSPADPLGECAESLGEAEIQKLAIKEIPTGGLPVRTNLKGERSDQASCTFRCMMVESTKQIHCILESFK